ncbi:hypothetical protein CHS0354_031167 [Potamilus streckersoni]|uniref:Uncharacterized protein n=1 Tax=Potamilus streckersoni TaxID=2493646 RepID=A0AAE0TMW1_9BIVA|nr:hypothetical protein CHS0354_031167 [Potamilus streckersoni]
MAKIYSKWTGLKRRLLQEASRKGNEKLSNICERLVKGLQTDVCKNDHPYPVTCIVSNVYDIGIACRMECPAMGCTKCIIDNNTGTISCRSDTTIVIFLYLYKLN